MTWRSVLITRASYLSVMQRALHIRQGNNAARIPLEDIAVIVLDHPQITLTGPLLSACAEQRITLISVNAEHLPAGLFLPFLPHHRTLKIVRAQLAFKRPQKKRLHQQLIQQKIRNQAAVLAHGRAMQVAAYLRALADSVRSGDPDNIEATAAQAYFQALHGTGFSRSQPVFINAALNYGYAVLRAALARSLVCHGFLPLFGLFHDNEQNPFNLADDLIEPYRPIVDLALLEHPGAESDHPLTTQNKAALVALLYRDIALSPVAPDDQARTVLAAIDASVTSLQRILLRQTGPLRLPLLLPTPRDTAPAGDTRIAE